LTINKYLLATLYIMISIIAPNISRAILSTLVRYSVIFT